MQSDQTESPQARRARAEAEEKARRIKARRGLDFVLPRWYRVPRCLPERGELLGSLHATYRTCSDSACRCHEGAEVHGPYWYRHYRDRDGRQHKTYVKRSDVQAVRAAIERRRARLAVERERRRKHLRLGKYARGPGGPQHGPRQSGGSRKA